MGDARQHRGARAQLRRRRKKSEGDQDLGRSRGGFSTKLHGLADGLGNPLRFALTAGQAGDAPVALPLLGTVEILAVEAVLADRADDSDVLLVWIVSQGAVPVIPPHPGRSAPRPTDWYLYKERARIECLFGKLEHFRRVFSRFDELVRRYLAFVHLAAVCILLR
ncbi:MAG: IS5 family transposase [Alphaproteobacteria bacterium]|nr:IS5 family transposase [Alphaproteobacteria bacterium]